jgi:hypothetical protein
MEIFGHAQISMTMNTYVYGNETMQREAAARIERETVQRNPVAVSWAVNPS